MSYFYSKKHNSVENDHTRKKFKLLLKTTYKNVFLRYQLNQRFLLLCYASRKGFLSYFYSKTGHNSGENARIGKKFKLVLNTICKKVLLKYQPNQRFPSFCQACRNGFLSYFYSKHGHNSVENDHNSKKFTLVLKTIYIV